MGTPVTITSDSELAWRAQPRVARMYVSLVIAAGALVLAATTPRSLPDPALFLFLLLTVCVTSAWKVNLPISLASGSTLSVSYAANLMALLLLGPRTAVAIGAVGAWVQCTVNVKRRYPLYRTAFSVAAEVLTMAVTGATYTALGGGSAPFDVPALLRPVVGAIAAYFVCNTALVAIAIGLSTRRPPVRVWREEFLWSATSFVVAGSAGAMAAVVVSRGEHWKAVVMIAPVYLAYQSYRLFIARLQDQKQHLDAMTRLQKERGELLERERAARASAEAANRLKDQFLATVSHELRTPMNAILGWADMLRLNALPADRRERACEAVFNNAMRQARLIDELLDMARIMAGKLQLERSDVDPREIAGAALEIIQISAESKRITIDVDIGEGLGSFYADGPRLQQVVWNLLANAVKFTPEGGVVRMAMRRAGEFGEIIVSDSGVGIPAEFLGSVFEPFCQADPSPTREYDGLGLGLAIAKQVVDAHGGTIDVASDGKGQGATFTVRLPVRSLGQRLTSVVDTLPSAVVADVTVARTI
jgi:signal transduction histidine kinase